MRALARFFERPSRLRGVSLDPVRTVKLPDAIVIGVGGATLGGSGRTPVAIAVARALDAVLVGHGYGGHARSARFVDPNDDPGDVGDEAILCARIVRTVVGPREEALALAARHARVVVVDRLLQTRPVKLAFALLAVDAKEPWGAGVTLPFGDLTAPRDRLLAACDEVVPVPRTIALPPLPPRVGVITSMARPHRLRTALHDHGISPRVFIERSDHALLHNLSIFNRRDVDAWLVDSKTAVHLRGRSPVNAPVIVVEHRVTLADDLLARISSRASC